MKKLLLITIIGLITLTANSQNLNRDNILLYTDTIAMSGGDVLIRDLYGFLPTYKPIDSAYYFPMRRVYYLNYELLVNRKEYYQVAAQDSIYIGSEWYTYEEIYGLIVTINEATWQTVFWEIFQQKIN